MSRSDWGELGKTAGLGALLAVLCAWLWFENVPDHPVLPAYEYGQSAESNYYPGGTSCKPNALLGLKGDEAVRKRDSCAQAAENYRLQSDDLVQQTRAADAAASSAYQAYRQTRLLLIGAILGLLTLFAAAMAAIYARKAFLTQDTSFKLLARPFVYLEKVKATKKLPGLYEIEFRVKNSGATPAINFCADLWGDVLPIGNCEHVIKPVRVSVNHIAPGTVRKLLKYVTVTDEEMISIRQTKQWLYLSIKATFDSRFVKGKEISESRAGYGPNPMKDFWIPQPDDDEILGKQPNIPNLLDEKGGGEEA